MSVSQEGGEDHPATDLILILDSSLCLEAKKHKKQRGCTLDQGQRSSSHTQPRHHPLKTLAQPAGKRDVGRVIEDVEERGAEM